MNLYNVGLNNFRKQILILIYCRWFAILEQLKWVRMHQSYMTELSTVVAQNGVANHFILLNGSIRELVVVTVERLSGDISFVNSNRICRLFCTQL